MLNKNLNFDEIISKLKPNIEKIANKYYIYGFEKEDIYQECYIGALSAMKYYDPKKNDNIYAFLNLAIERRIIMLLKKSKTGKNLSMAKSVSLDEKLKDSSNESFIDFLKSDRNQFEELKRKNMQDEKIESLKKHLSKLETKILDEYLKGLSYTEIANKIGKTEKSVDNALQRIKGKVKLLDKEKSKKQENKKKSNNKKN